MKTFIIDLDGIDSSIFKELMGFVLTIGLNFRKLDKKAESGTSRTLFVETETKKEVEKLEKFLKESGFCSFSIVHDDMKATQNDKTIGIFSQLHGDSKEYYLDNSTGKRFSIVR